METIETLKKYDLHCHLDGSLSRVTMRKLAKLAGKNIPDEEEQLRKLLQVQPDCRSLQEYLEKFDLPLSCLVTEESFRIAVQELMEDAASERVAYLEIRFAPLLSVSDSLSMKNIIESALDGLRDAMSVGDIEGRLILCGMRHMPVEENIKVVETAREYLSDGVCAVDLAGDEASYPVLTQRKMFHRARELQVPYTIHAGECGSAQSVWDALELGASRIGHGIAIKKDKKLLQYCVDHKIPLEMCPTSNLQTKAIASMREYPLLDFLEAGIPVTVNTDNRTVSGTTITRELQLLTEYYGLTMGDLQQLMDHAAQGAFGK